MRMPMSAILCLAFFGWFSGSAFGQQAFSWRDAMQRFEKAVGEIAVEFAGTEPARPAGLFVPTSPDAADAPPSKWIPLDSIEHPSVRLVVLVHGLDEPGDIWTNLAPAIVAAGHDIARFEYPNDQPVHPSAALLIERLKAARASGVEEVALVAHSMGGLVAFDALTRADGYDGKPDGGGTLPRVTRLITIGTPWSGSPWARLQAVSELREQVQRWAEGESWDLRPLLRDRGDVKGRAGEDLGEKSKLVAELKERPTPEGLPLTVIAGRIVTPDPADWSWVRESLVLRKVLGREAVEELVAEIETIGGTLGDGVVPLESALARGSADAAIFEANHRGLIRQTPIDFATGSGAKNPPAIATILECLEKDGANPPAADRRNPDPPAPTEAPRLSHRGLHGYISSSAGETPPEFRYGAGFYASVWSLIDRPIGGFQIGLPSTWIIPDNSDNLTEPLCPPGTIARDHWPERGPTYSSVFQTMEGGLGYWAGNRFHYGPPKFSMNATPDCYSNEVASPGWPFFRSSEPLPDDRLGIAQISNRLLIPPDGLPFEGEPMGALLGYAYMALPLTDAREDPQPTGNLSWTLFLDAANFKGPLAYYLPECWSRVSREFPFDHGRGLDARAASGGLSGAMEINTVPSFTARARDGVEFSKIPQLQFPTDEEGRTILVRDVTMYSKAAIYDDVMRWRAGGPAPTGAFHPDGAASPTIGTGPVTYRQEARLIEGINEHATPTVFAGDVFGIQWSGPPATGVARLPTYYREEGDRRVAVVEADVPEETGLVAQEFPAPNPSPPPYSAEPLRGAWANPGPAAGPFEVTLLDGSTVRYSWYRFIDQPVFGQFDWTPQDREELQAMIERMHRHWKIDRTYLPGPSAGELARFDPALFVRAPKGFEIGYVPIVTWQGIAEP